MLFDAQLIDTLNGGTYSQSVIDLGVQIEGDFNGDNIVDIADYSGVITNIGRLTSDLNPAEAPLDFNQDGVIDVIDYSLILLNFGKFGEEL